MNLILLPGKNQSNLNWIKDVEQAVKPHFDATAVQYYNHWQEEDQSLIDIDHESSEMYQTCRDWADYAVFAKSAGVIIALKTIHEKKLTPQKCIFVGSAIMWALAAKLPLETWLSGYNIPTLFIQQAMDPAMYFEELKQFILAFGIKPAKFHELTGKSHQYHDVEELKGLVEGFVK